MTITDEMVEKALHAYMQTDCSSPKEAMRVALSAVIPEGSVVVPREPTMEMREAAIRDERLVGRCIGQLNIREAKYIAKWVYRAMLDAAP